MVYNLYSHRFLARFTLPGIRLLLLSSPSRQLLITNQNIASFIALLGVSVLLEKSLLQYSHKIHNWVGLLRSYLPTLKLMKLLLTETMRALHGRGGFQFYTSLLSPYPVKNTCGVFSNWVLSSSSSRNPRSRAMTCIVWGRESFGIPDQKLKCRYQSSALGFLTLERTLLFCEVAPVNLYY